jgi:hypothetical protein
MGRKEVKDTPEVVVIVRTNKRPDDRLHVLVGGLTLGASDDSC